MVVGLTLLISGPCRPARAIDWYVANNGAGWGTNGWADATNSLQGAINNSAVSDTIWVSNGVYDAGGVTNYPAGTILTNRIAIWKAITVRSKDNDPTNTIIKGARASDGNTNGPDAVRCVYMAANSTLIGFTLTNGSTMTTGTDLNKYGGGVYCPSITTPAISNCIITGNSANSYASAVNYGSLLNCTLTANRVFGGAYSCGGTYYSILSNCTAAGNSVDFRGAVAYGGTLYNCTLTGNYAGEQGGVAYGAAMYNCTLTSNSALSVGGAVSGGSLYNCTLTGNSTTAGNGQGGGAISANLYNCILTRNSSWRGGGATGSTLYNCLLTGNAASNGGGEYNCTMYNCTLTGNQSGSGYGGGAYAGTLYNCIVCYNYVSGVVSNWTVATFTYSCTTPSPGGTGNIADDPMLIDKGSSYGLSHVAGNYRLSARSPCINAGTNYSWMTDGSVTSKDLDYRQRIRYGTVDMGAFENIRSGSIYGFR